MRLGLVLKKYRVIMELDLRSLSREIGIGTATLMRIEHGRVPDLLVWKKIEAWLLNDAAIRQGGRDGDG